MAGRQAIALLSFTTLAAMSGGGAHRSRIVGTYTLAHRELPDGTVARPPDVLGCMTYTDTHRNFNVFWKEAGGRRYSMSYVATCTLDNKEYAQESLYRVTNDEITGPASATTFRGPARRRPCRSPKGVWSFSFRSTTSRGWRSRATVSPPLGRGPSSTAGRRSSRDGGRACHRPRASLAAERRLVGLLPNVSRWKAIADLTSARAAS